MSDRRSERTPFASSDEREPAPACSAEPHIEDEIRDLTDGLDGIGFAAFAETYVLRRTAEHAILIISAAVKALSPAFTDHRPGVGWRAVPDIGNVLRHEYFEIDPRVVWRIIEEHLPGLQRVIERMIAEISKDRS